MRGLAGALVVLVVAMGCSQPCARVEQATSSFLEKGRPCLGSGLGMLPRLDAESCRDAVQACTPADLAAIERYLACLEALDGCTEATRDEWSRSVLACAQDLSVLAKGCYTP